MNHAQINENFKLVISQIENRLDSTIDVRPNYILSGPVASGKSKVGKLLASRNNGLYVSFIEEHAHSFLARVDYLDIDGVDLLDYIKREITDRTEAELVIIDGIEFALNQIYADGNIDNFLYVYRRMIFDKKIIMIVSNIYTKDVQLNTQMCFNLKNDRGV